MAYLALGALASAVPGPLTAGAWSVAWVFPTVLPAALGLRLVGCDRAARALGALTGALGVAGALLVEPAVPFQGIATAAPEGWRAAGAVDVLLVGWYAALLAAVVTCARARSVRATAVASAAPCLVVTCLALAVLRGPGEVDPGAGSVAYLVAIAVTAIVVTAPWALRGLAALWALDVVVLGGVAAVAALPATLAVVAVAALTLSSAVAAITVVARLERPVAPTPAPSSRGVPGLSPRENDVLAGVAAGLTNAGVAAELFLSERTVEQHLRSVFDKLDLGDHGATNRRVRAAAIWWSHQPATSGTPPAA